jgi:hypothetical protein
MHWYEVDRIGEGVILYLVWKYISLKPHNGSPSPSSNTGRSLIATIFKDVSPYSP